MPFFVAGENYQRFPKSLNWIRGAGEEREKKRGGTKGKRKKRKGWDGRKNSASALIAMQTAVIAPTNLPVRLSVYPSVRHSFNFSGSDTSDLQ